MNAALAVGLRALRLPTMIRVFDEARILSEREGEPGINSGVSQKPSLSLSMQSCE